MKKLANVLMVLGVLIMLYPAVGAIYTRYQENRLLSEWLHSSSEDIYLQATGDDAESAFLSLEESYRDEHISYAGMRYQNDEELAANDPQTVQQHESQEASGESNGDSPDLAPSPKSTPKSSATSVKQKVLGVIIIDKIKIKYPIVEGIQKENLRTAIGHIPGTAPLGEAGNCALAGHRSYTFGAYFNRLDELDVGDEITIKTKDKDYIYTVYEKLVVKPDDVSVIKGGKDDYILTLITCTPIYIATHRLIIHARLENPPVSETPLPTTEAPHHEPQDAETSMPENSAPDADSTTVPELSPETQDISPENQIVIPDNPSIIPESPDISTENQGETE
ncbi:MAG TPA: sortase [Thermoclostridium sp.]